MLETQYGAQAGGRRRAGRPPRRRTMAIDRGCPGQDRSNWTADDIFEVACGNCGALVEFFKDDARRYCRSCGACVPNPKQDVGCAACSSFATR
jgi:hypothetical protein